MNQVYLTGRISIEPKSYISSDGKTTIVRFSLAVDNPYNENVVFLNLVTFNEVGKHILKEGRKGMQLFIEGYINSYSRETEGGKKYTNVEIVGNKVTLIKPEKSEIGSDFNPETEGGGIL